jgi:TM2 domain-containing membrane protein YozV
MSIHRTTAVPLVLALLAVQALGAQAVAAGTDSPSVRTVLIGQKAPALAGLLGVWQPGGGHWYAGEYAKGLVTATLFWSAIAVGLHNRDTDARSETAAAVVGVLGFSVIDGVLAARRYNKRLALAASGAPVRDTIRASSPKSSVGATLLSSLLPGAGQLYAGDARTGSVLLGVFAAGCVIGGTGENLQANPIPAALVSGAWWYAVIDAHRAVESYNRSDGSRLSIEPRVWPGLAGTHGGKPRVGLALSVGF